MQHLHATSEEKLPEITLDRILSKAEQVEMGLHKLTPQERDKLRIYIIDMFLKGIEEGKKQMASAQLPNVIESKIDGDFEGWEGAPFIAKEIPAPSSINTRNSSQIDKWSNMATV